MDQLVVETAETDNVMTLTTNRMLNESENDLLMRSLKELEQRLGLKVIVIPFSTAAVNSDLTDVVDGEK